MEKLPDLPPVELDDYKPSPNATTWDNIAERAAPFGTAQEALDDEKEKLEKRMREKVLEIYEDSINRERKSYRHVSDALDDAGFRSFSRLVDDHSEATARIDTRFSEAIVDYIDAKFSTGTQAARNQEESWDECQRGTRQRAGVLDDTLSSIRRGLFMTENPRFEETADRVSRMDSTIPDEQIMLLRAYKAYFDNPTKQSRQRLDEALGNYNYTVRSSLNGLAENIASSVPRGDEIYYALGSELGKSICRGREEIHDAIIDYYTFKKENSPNATPEQPEAQKPEIVAADRLEDLFI